MQRLPGFVSLRFLSTQKAIRCWQLQHSMDLVSPNLIKLGSVSSILSTYRYICYRSMYKMSVAMLRRSSLKFLEKTSKFSSNAAGLPAAMRNYLKSVAQKTMSRCQEHLLLPTSNVWASSRALNAFSTDSKERTALKYQKRRKELLERHLGPIIDLIEKERYMEFKKMQAKELIKAENQQKREQINAKADKPPPAPTTPKSRSSSVSKERDSSNNSFKPYLKLDDSSHSISKRETLPSNAKRTSSVQYLIARRAVAQKIGTHDLTLLKSEKGSMQGTDTFETRLRAQRTAKPLKLRAPTPEDNENLYVTQQYRRKSSRPTNESKSLPQSSRKYGPRTSFKTTSIVLPTAKAHEMPNPTTNTLTRTKEQGSTSTESEKASKDVNRNKKTANQHPEREDLNFLLADLLDKTPDVPTGSIEFKKTAPLFKLVTTSIEGRRNLHHKLFEKQLNVPLTYKQSSDKIVTRSQDINRRAIFLGHTAALRAKALLETRLNTLLKTNKDDEYYGDDDEDEEGEDCN